MIASSKSANPIDRLIDYLQIVDLFSYQMLRVFEHPLQQGNRCKCGGVFLLQSPC